MISVSVVIPVYRGAQTIGPLVESLIFSLRPKYELEIVLVNDCSPDSSEEVCLGLHRDNSSIVKFYSLAKNVGEHGAVLAGLGKSTGEWVVIMDDDFQNPVSEAIKLISYAASNTFDVVYTCYDKKHHSMFRNFGSWFNDKVAAIMLRKPKGLYLSSFKVMSRFLVDEIVKYSLPFPYIDGLILRTTSNIGRLLVEHHDSRRGGSGYTLKKLVSLWLSMFTNFSIVPLRAATGIGFIFSLFGFLMGIEIVLEKMSNAQLPIGYALFVFLITVFAGIQLMAIGVIGEYLGRTFLYLSKEPQYTIRKSFDSGAEAPPDGKNRI